MAAQQGCWPTAQNLSGGYGTSGNTAKNLTPRVGVYPKEMKL